jgi:hypothetical protein
MTMTLLGQTKKPSMTGDSSAVLVVLVRKPDSRRTSQCRPSDTGPTISMGMVTVMAEKAFQFHSRRSFLSFDAARPTPRVCFDTSNSSGSH